MPFWEEFQKNGFKELARVESKYQCIQIVERIDNVISLVLDAREQFNSGDEFRYHECLGVWPLCLHKNPERALILGGGDGLLAGLLLRCGVKHVTLVELDEKVIEVCREYIGSLNNGALEDERVEIIIADAYKYMQIYLGEEQYDLVCCDYTDPYFLPSAKVYTLEHLKDIKQWLNPGGIVTMQLLDPAIQPEAYWCMVGTFTGVYAPERMILPYHTYLPYMRCASAFCAAVPAGATMQKSPDDLGLQYLSLDLYDKLRIFSKDEVFDGDLVPSTMTTMAYALYAGRKRLLPYLKEKVVYEDIRDNQGRLSHEVSARVT